MESISIEIDYPTKMFLYSFFDPPHAKITTGVWEFKVYNIIQNSVRKLIIEWNIQAFGIWASSHIKLVKLSKYVKK